jgi:hypothetical protein
MPAWHDSDMQRKLELYPLESLFHWGLQGATVTAYDLAVALAQ